MSTEQADPKVGEAALALVQDDDAYEKAFNDLVAKREADKAGESQEVAAPAQAAPESADPKPAEVEGEAGEEAAKEAAAKEAVASPDDDLLAAVPEDRRDALAKRLKAAEDAEARARKLENDNRSLAGRIGAYQRRYEEAAGKRPVEVAKQATAEQSAEWTQFAQDYPDIAKAIEARYAAAQPTAADPRVADVVQFVEDEKRQRFLTDAWETVETVHPGWREIGSTKEFQEWKGSSPSYAKLAASDDVSDAIALFDLYEAHRLKSGLPGVDPTEAAEAAKLAARRGAQLEGARTPRDKQQSPNHGVDLNDPDQLFDFYAKKSNARLKARYS